MTNRASWKHDFGQTITSDAAGVSADLALLAHIGWPELSAATTDSILDGIEAPETGEEAEDLLVEEFDEQPDFPRNVVVVVAATTAGHVAGEDIVVTGKNIAGEEISEAFAIVADTPATHTGNLAFAEITSVLIPVQDGDSVTVDVGVGKKMGIPYKLAYSTLVSAYLDHTTDTGTLTVDADDIEKNVFTPNGTPDGEKDVDIYLIV